jgi:hypothetical protein
MTLSQNTAGACSHSMSSPAVYACHGRLLPVHSPALVRPRRGFFGQWVHSLGNIATNQTKKGPQSNRSGAALRSIGTHSWPFVICTCDNLLIGSGASASGLRVAA